MFHQAKHGPNDLYISKGDKIHTWIWDFLTKKASILNLAELLNKYSVALIQGALLDLFHKQ